MKIYNSIYPSKNSNLLRFGLLAAVATLCAGSASAQFSTGFETSSGYTVNGQLAGVHDSAAPGSNVWVTNFGSPSNITSSNTNPQSGELSMQVTAPGNASQSAYLNLGSSAPTSKPFTVQFGWAVSTDMTPDTGNQSQIYFGGSNGPSGLSDASTPFWFGLFYDDGKIRLSTWNRSTNNVSRVEIGSYTTFSDLGDYINVSISIDPTTNRYTSVILSGQKSSDDVTAIILASNDGTIPYKNGTPDNNFSVAAGANDAGSFYLDNLSVTQIPEPSTIAFLAMSSCAAILIRLKSRQTRRP